MKIKCIDNKGNWWFTVGKTYKAWEDSDGDIWSSSDDVMSLCHGELSLSAHGVFELVEEEKPHPHADLMLKCAMIAQYDDKPWECFEFKNHYTDGWSRMADNPCFSTENEYRLKPQEPKIQFGQTWVDLNGTQAIIKLVSDGIVFFDIPVGGLNMQHSLEKDYFLKNFKLKESK